MARSRHMLHSLGSSMSFGMLSLKAKVLWPMLIAEADDQGRHDIRAKVVKWGVCQNVDEIEIEDIPGLLEEMVQEEMLVVYGESLRFGQIRNWWDHQPMNYARPSKYPPPPGWHDRIRYHNGKEMVTDGWDAPGGFAESTEDDPPIVPPNDTPKDGGQLNLTKLNSTEPKRGTRKRDPRLDHKAIIGFREFARLHVPVVMRDDWITCADEVGVDHLLAIVKEWIGKGYKPLNVLGMMKVAREGWIHGADRQEPQLTPEEIAIYFSHP